MVTDATSTIYIWFDGRILSALCFGNGCWKVTGYYLVRGRLVDDFGCEVTVTW